MQASAMNHPPSDPMTLGNKHQFGVQRLAAHCFNDAAARGRTARQ